MAKVFQPEQGSLPSFRKTKPGPRLALASSALVTMPARPCLTLQRGGRATKEVFLTCVSHPGPGAFAKDDSGERAIRPAPSRPGSRLLTCTAPSKRAACLLQDRRREEGTRRTSRSGRTRRGAVARTLRRLSPQAQLRAQVSLGPEVGQEQSGGAQAFQGLPAPVHHGRLAIIIQRMVSSREDTTTGYDQSL